MAVPRKKVAPKGALAGREVILGVCGSIAAYKIPELVRRLRCDEATVTCILTENGARFVTALTLETLSNNRVLQGMFDPFVRDVEHIALARRADVIVVVPATADTIARLAAGQAGDLLSSVVLATRSPILVCPAMNEGMWSHPATQTNVRRLKEYGYHIVPPERGELACGTEGVGRLASLEAIHASIAHTVAAR